MLTKKENKEEELRVKENNEELKEKYI